MNDAGVDVITFKPHSTMAASTSKAKAVAVHIRNPEHGGMVFNTRCSDRYCAYIINQV